MNNFFDIMKNILLKTGDDLYKDENFKKHFSAFMLVRYLSMKDNLLPYAQILNKFQCTLSSEQIYRWCYKNIPKQKSGFIKYISKNKKGKNKNAK